MDVWVGFGGLGGFKNKPREHYGEEEEERGGELKKWRNLF